MVAFRQFIRPEIMASAIAHLSIVALVFVYAQAHPFASVPTQSVNVDIVTPEEIEQKAEPAPSPSPQLPPDLSAMTKAETPAQPPAAQAPSLPPRQAARPNRKEAALRPQPEPSPAQAQPQTQAAPAPSAAPAQPSANPAPAPSPSVGYVPPEPDVTVKYNVMLGLPEALPPSVLSADAGDKTGDGGDAAAKADVGSDMVTAFRGRIKQCSKLPSSLSPTDDLMIKLRILMTPAGRLAAEPMVKEGTASVKAVDLKNSAVAALSACQPYTMLPREKYDEWKVIDLTFTPRDFSS
jgi:type IV secretory pathway VirB10-like protein